MLNAGNDCGSLDLLSYSDGSLHPITALPPAHLELNGIPTTAYGQIRQY